MRTILRKTKNAIKLIKTNGFRDFLFTLKRYTTYHLRSKAKKKTDYLELSIPESDKDAIVLKKGSVVNIVTSIPYYDTGGGQRGAQLARTFNKMGFRVKFYYSNMSQDPQKGNVEIPVETHSFIDENTIEYINLNTKKDDLFIFESPLAAFEPILNIAVSNNCKIVYENIDNWETSLGNNVLFEETLVKLLTHADVLVGTSRPLVEQLNKYLDKYSISKDDKKVVYLANAVDDELFCGTQKHEMPSDLVKGEKTFLYYGSLWGEWFDWDLVIEFAQKNPTYAINLIGNYDGIGHIIKKCPSNVHFLGFKIQRELPAYLQYIDFSIIPFERGKIGDYVSPIKIFEYIAMYSNVISTSLPDIEGYPNVYCGDTASEWEKIVAESIDPDVDAADIFVNENTWFSRATGIIDALGLDIKSTNLKDNLSIVILNYNNKNVIFKCVNSLLYFREKYGYKIIVVDNGSVDGSYELLQERYKNDIVLVCRNDRNGCASGRNLGVTNVETDYVLFLDSDQWVSNKYWLKAYEDIMDSCEDFGAIGWAAGYFNPTGSSGTVVDELPYHGMLPQGLCRKDIGYLGSGGMLMRTSDFREIEGFDTSYDPTCFEDTDISLKMRHYGKELYFCPHLGVIHLPHQTTEKVFSERKLIEKNNKDYFIRKWREKNPGLLKYVR